MVDVMWRLRESLKFIPEVPLNINLFQILQPLNRWFLVTMDSNNEKKIGGFIISPNQHVDKKVVRFHPLNILPASGCVDCVTGLSHNAVWRSCIHKDVRDCGGLAT